MEGCQHMKSSGAASIKGEWPPVRDTWRGRVDPIPGPEPTRPASLLPRAEPTSEKVNSEQPLAHKSHC